MVSLSYFEMVKHQSTRKCSQKSSLPRAAKEVGMKIIKLFLAIAVFSWMGQGLLFAQTADEELSDLLKRVI